MIKSSTAVKSQQSELDLIKAKQKATWQDGDYANFAKFMEAGANEILDSWNIPANKRLLDIGCGAGQTAIPAAKKGIHVTGVDIAENLIEHARKRAHDARLLIQFDVGDAEDLPYGENKFDVVISMFGAMFAPRPHQVAEEFARVLPSGGQLYMANWTPNSMPAQMFRAVSSIVPPAAGFIPPALWGDEDTVKQRLADEFTDIKLTRKIYPQWHYPFGTHELVALFRKFFGPVKRAFDVIDKNLKLEFHQMLETIYRTNSEIHNGILTITNGEYLEVIATRR